MNRKRAENLGWTFELNDEPGAVSYARKQPVTVDADKVLHLQEEQVIATPSDVPEETLLANIAELEGEPFQPGYGIYEETEPQPDPREQALAELAGATTIAGVKKALEKLL